MMFIPMEIFSHGPAVSDIGNAARQRGSPSGGGFSGFDQIFAAANAHPNEETGAARTDSSRWNHLEGTARFRQTANHDNHETGQYAQIYYDAGPEHQTEVTYILEGDTESTITPKSMYEAEAPAYKAPAAEEKPVKKAPAKKAAAKKKEEK